MARKKSRGLGAEASVHKHTRNMRLAIYAAESTPLELEGSS